MQMSSGTIPSVSGGIYGDNGYAGGAFTCYLTDKGSVYCSGSADAVAPVISHGNGDIAGGAYSTVKAGSNAYGTYSWIKVDTSKLDSSSSSAGRTITITGSKLSKVTGVYIDSNKNGQLDTSTDAQCTNLSIKSDAQLTCTAPQLSPGTYNLFVVNASNQTMVPNALTYR